MRSMQSSPRGCISRVALLNRLPTPALKGVGAAESSAPHQFDAPIVNNSLAVSPDGRTAVASDSRVPGVRVYDLKSGRLLKTLGGFGTARNSLFTPDGKTLLISGSTGHPAPSHIWLRRLSCNIEVSVLYCTDDTAIG
jgi:WD40 repeat protein